MCRGVLLLLVLTLLVSACGGPNRGEKIAVVTWDKVLEQHPSAAQRKALEQEFDELRQKRMDVAVQGQAQLSTLARMQAMKQRTQQNFMAADFQTRMAERQTIANEQMQQLYNAAMEKAKKATAADEAELEEAFQLEMFNVRLKLDTVRMKPDDRKQLEARLAELQQQREQARMVLRAHQAKLVAAELEPERERLMQELDAYAKSLHEQQMQQLEQQAKADEEKFQQGPESLGKLLESIDGKLDEKQQALETLENAMRTDIESAVTKLARERGYSVVFHKFRVNVKADDITQDVVQELQKMQRK